MSFVTVLKPLIPPLLNTLKKAAKHIIPIVVDIIFNRPKQQNPEDIAERSRQQKRFCDQINAQASHVESAVVETLHLYKQNLVKVIESSSDMLDIHPSQINNLARQVEMLTKNVPGMIATDVSKHFNDSDPAYHRVLWMLPGPEKEQEIQRFTSQVIQNAIEHCAHTCEEIIEQIQESFIDLIQAQKDLRVEQLKKAEDEIAAMRSSLDDRDKRLALQAKAELIITCCNIIDDELREG